MVFREFCSPVPAQTCIVSDGAMARAPIETTGSLSKRGRKVTPALVVFQIPPPAAAAAATLVNATPARSGAIRKRCITHSRGWDGVGVWKRYSYGGSSASVE